jgi:4-diphosphocytidyl-2-C-methyl-D-erythritol kinase
LLTTSGLSVTHAKDNAVLKAHAALEEAAKHKLPAHFHLHKRIPPGSGMGGASSDAAAALRGLKDLFHLDVDIAPIAIQLGADVPYFLHGGRMRAEGRGEKLTALTMQHAMYAIAWPGIELMTAKVYDAWDEVQGDGPNELARAAQHVEPRIQEFAQALGDEWRMTGSGSAFFKETADHDAPHLEVWTTVAHAVGPWS